MVASLETIEFKPGQEVFVKKGNKKVKRIVGDKKGIGQHLGQVLTLGGRTGKQEIWENPWNLQLVDREASQASQKQSDEAFETLKQDESVLNGKKQLLEKVWRSLSPMWNAESTLWEDFQERGETDFERDRLTEALKNFQSKGMVVSDDGYWKKSDRYAFKLWIDIQDEVVEILHLPVTESNLTFSIAEINPTLEQFEKQDTAKRSLNTNQETVWPKDVPNADRNQQQTQETLQEQESLPSTTFAAELAWDSQQHRSSLEDLKSSDSARLTATVETSSASDTPVFQLQETLELEKTLQGLNQELSQLRQTANHLVSMENGGGQTTSETFSQHSSISLEVANQNISVLRMLQESSVAPTNLEEPPEDFLNGFSGSFPAAGIMCSGKLSTAQSLELPSLENDSFWLRSPQALSSSSEETRPPGQSKLEVQLKELGLLGQQEVLNPEFLAKGLYNLPANWANPSVSLPATEILEIKEKPTEIALTPDQLPLPSVTSSELKKPEEKSKNKKQVEAVQLAQATKQLMIAVLEQIREGLHWIDPNLITLDAGTQSRVETDKPTVSYYAEQMKNDLWEWEASPVGLLWDGEALLPWDGHHRIEAAIAAGKNLLARVQQGDLRRAIALSCGSNKKPSLRRTREDNQKTIEMLEDLRKQHGDEWLLQIINAELPQDKQFKEVSLRAIESYTGIPFSTIRNVQKRKKTDKDKEKTEKIAFTPTPDEMQIIETIMEAEELDKPSEVIRWLLQNYQES